MEGLDINESLILKYTVVCVCVCVCVCARAHGEGQIEVGRGTVQFWMLAPQ